MKGNEHLLRWKSAIVMLAIILVVGIIDNIFLTWLFFGVVLWFGSIEAARLLKLEDKFVFFLIAIGWIGALFLTQPIYTIFILLIIFASKLAYDKSVDKIGFILILYPFSSLIFIWMLYLNYHMISLVWLLVIVALSDVGAYYVGRAIGKRAFSPTSPKKTLEGVFGGVGAATIVGSIFISSTSNISFLVALILAFFTSLSGVFGDLFESYLKREAGVKDSGDLIPGHGGVLDRVDGYLFAGVILYILLELF